jgi:hypothetical protein
MDTQSSPIIKPTLKRSRRKLYAVISVLIVVSITLASFLALAPSDETMDLNLKYSIGERMVYQTTGYQTHEWINTSLTNPESNKHYDNYTIHEIQPIEVIGESNSSYSVDLNTQSEQNNYPPFYGIENVSKNPCNSFLTGYGAPLIFDSASNNAELAAYYHKTSVRAGDIWTLQLSGNTSFALVGQVTITFAGIEELTVPAGTYRTMHIDVSSNVLTYDPNGPSPVIRTKDMTLQFNGTTYLEQSTCRLIKADISQVFTWNTSGVNSTNTLHSEETLIQYTK